MRRVDTGVDDNGYLAPFAYYRLVLFDLARGKVVAQEDVRTSSAYPLASSGESDVWNVLTPEQKIDEMERLLNKSIGPALGNLVAMRERG